MTNIRCLRLHMAALCLLLASLLAAALAVVIVVATAISGPASV